MREVPIEVELSWPFPNYVDPPTKAHGIVVGFWVCVPVICLITFARLYSRLCVSRYFGWDDWMFIPAFVTALGYCLSSLLGIHDGWYKHIWDLRYTEIVETRKMVVANCVLAVLNVTFTKISVLLLYIRLFPPSTTRIVIYVLLIIITGWCVAEVITSFLLCIPLRAYWDISYTGPQVCLGEVQFFVSFSGIDLALDVAIFVLPIPKLTKLAMPRRQKIALVGIFGTGLLAVGAAALRLPSLVRASASYDLTWELYDAALCSMIEACVGIFCASAPALKPLIQRLWPSVLGASGSSGNRPAAAGYSIRELNSAARKDSAFDVLSDTLSKQGTPGAAVTVAVTPKDIEEGAAAGRVHNFRDSQGWRFWKGHLALWDDNDEESVLKPDDTLERPEPAYRESRSKHRK